MKILIALLLITSVGFAQYPSVYNTSTGYSEYQYVVIGTPGSGTWTAPNGVPTITAECWGGGGSGGSAQNSGATGGGAAGGQYARISMSVTGNTSYNYSVAAAQTTSGTNGNDSWFNNSSTVIAKGGSFGQNTTSGSGLNGVGSTLGGIGDVVYSGGSGTSGGTGGAGGGGAGNTGSGFSASGTSGGGFTLAFGGGGGNGLASAGSGNAGSYAGGAGGGGKADNSTERAGGYGAQGIIVINYRTTHLGFF